MLDVDGTLIPGALAAPLPARLVDTGLCPRDRWARLRAFLVGSPADQLETSALADKANRLFAAMLTDVPCRAVSEVVADVWLRQREQVFDFVRPLVDTLRDARFTVVLISGGPEEMVAHLAADLGIDRFRGTSFAAEEGIYTGVVGTGANSGKEQVAWELTGGTVSWPESVALGNTLGDASLLARTGSPVAFEPSPALLVLARAGGWLVVDRHDIGSVLPERLGLGADVCPRHRPSRRSAPPVGTPPRLRHPARRLADRVLAEVGPNGAITGRCASRVTESALMLTLLRGERLLPDVQQSLRRYLERSAAGASSFDAAVIDATLYAVPVHDPDRLIEETFAGAEQPSSERKRMALAAVLAVVGPSRSTSTPARTPSTTAERCRGPACASWPSGSSTRLRRSLRS